MGFWSFEAARKMRFDGEKGTCDRLDPEGIENRFAVMVKRPEKTDKPEGL